MQIRDDDGAEELVLNLAPMIDIVFLLLIFFMVTTTFVEKEKEFGIDLPTAQSGDEASFEADEIVINLLRDGLIKLNGEEVSSGQLDALLQSAAQANPGTPVTIRGDRGVVLQRVVAVMDSCRIAGLADIGLMNVDG